MKTMQRIDPALITDRLEAGTLLRGEWGDGHDRACLLAAIYAPCAVYQTPTECPASLMPEWMAQITVLIDDALVNNEHYEAIIRRYAKLAGRWWVLDEAAWGRLYHASIETAMDATYAAAQMRPLHTPSLPFRAAAVALNVGAPADRLITAMLDAIEQEITDAE